MPAPVHIPDPNKFDLVTHQFDGRGKLASKNPYRLHIKDGSQYYERPVDSGNLWYENNQPAGRVEVKGGVKLFDTSAPHKLYQAPPTGQEKLYFQNEELRFKNEALIAELESIKAEREVKPVAPQAEPVVEARLAPPSLKPITKG